MPLPDMEQKDLSRSTADAAARLLQARGRALGEQQAVPHAMELVATLSDVDLVNDSRSTFLDATLRSMAALQTPIVWIAGAQVAGISAEHVQEFLRRRVVAVVFFGEVDETILEELRTVIDAVYSAQEVRTATFLARELASEGKTILFSPACPSGDGFANYEERGAEFKRAVRDL